MTIWLRTIGLAALALAVWFGVLPALLSGGDRMPPERITTDNAAYCQKLAERIEILAHAAPTEAVPAEALGLRAQGQRLCTQGRVRDGLICLRRAVLLLHHPASPTGVPPIGVSPIGP